MGFPRLQPGFAQYRDNDHASAGAQQPVERPGQQSSQRSDPLFLFHRYRTFLPIDKNRFLLPYRHKAGKGVLPLSCPCFTSFALESSGEKEKSFQILEAFMQKESRLTVMCYP